MESVAVILENTDAQNSAERGNRKNETRDEMARIAGVSLDIIEKLLFSVSWMISRIIRYSDAFLVAVIVVWTDEGSGMCMHIPGTFTVISIAVCVVDTVKILVAQHITGLNIGCQLVTNWSQGCLRVLVLVLHLPVDAGKGFTDRDTLLNIFSSVRARHRVSPKQ